MACKACGAAYKANTVRVCVVCDVVWYGCRRVAWRLLVLTYCFGFSTATHAEHNQPARSDALLQCTTHAVTPYATIKLSRSILLCLNTKNRLSSHSTLLLLPQGMRQQACTHCSSTLCPSLFCSNCAAATAAAAAGGGGEDGDGAAAGEGAGGGAKCPRLSRTLPSHEVTCDVCVVCMACLVCLLVTLLWLTALLTPASQRASFTQWPPLPASPPTLPSLHFRPSHLSIYPSLLSSTY